MKSHPFYLFTKRILPVDWFVTKTWIGFQLRRVAKHIEWFGLRGGVQVLLHKRNSSNEPVEVVSKALAFPVYLRSCTTDPQVFVEVLIDRIYANGIPSAARFILDAGANIGLTSIFLANRYPEATIVAIEPSQENLDLLQRNIRPYPKIQAKLAGIWPIETPLRIINAEDEAWGFKVAACAENESTMRGLTVPALLKEFSMPRVDILKIDIEGAEWPLFFEAKPDWLDSVDCILMEIHARRKNDDFIEMISLIKSHGLFLAHVSENNYCFVRK